MGNARRQRGGKTGVRGSEGEEVTQVNDSR